MNIFKSLFFILISLFIFSSCSTEENLDCNLIEHGLALIDDCGDCQKVSIYNFVSHQSYFIDDTTGVVLGQTEMFVFPNDPANPYWNSGCNSIAGSINELDASNWIFDTSQGPFNPIATGSFIKFSFELGEVVQNDSIWDIAFRGPTIIVNGGQSSNIDQPFRTGNAAVYIADGTMKDIQSVELQNLIQDSITRPAIIDDLGFTGQGWCIYSGISDNFTTHYINPIPGKILVFRTHDNKYAKMEILNFYDNPITSLFGGFYTFNYVYDTDINF